jgi:O-antigen/teichoic acid export membrane protein
LARSTGFGRAIHPRRLWARATRASRFGSLLALTFVSNVLIAALGVLSGMLSARLLGPGGRGELAAIQMWPQFFATLAPLGLGQALGYYVARRPQEAGRWLTTGLLYGLVSTLVFMAAGYGLMPYLLSAQPAAVVEAGRAYMWFVPLTLVLTLFAAATSGRNDLVAWNLQRALPAAVWAVTLVVFLFAGLADASLLARTYLLVLAGVAVTVSAALVRLRMAGPFKPAADMVRPLATYGLPVVLSGIPSILNSRLDQIFLAAFLEPSALGLYVTAVAWGGAGSMFANTMVGVAFPRVAGTIDAAQQAREVAQISRLGLAVCLLVTAAATLAAPVAVPLLFGREFAAAVPAALLITPAAGVSSYNLLLETGALGRGKPHFVLISEGAGLGAALLLLWLLLARYGLAGAACVSLMTNLLRSAVLLNLVARHTGTGLKELLLPSRADAALLIGKLRAVRLT